MEILILVLVVCIAVWAAVRLYGRAEASADSVVADAWRVVLSDPKYEERRPLEERKHAAEREATTLAEAARQRSHAG